MVPVQVHLEVLVMDLDREVTSPALLPLQEEDYF